MCFLASHAPAQASVGAYGSAGFMNGYASPAMPQLYPYTPQSYPYSSQPAYNPYAYPAAAPGTHHSPLTTNMYTTANLEPLVKKLTG